MSFWSWLTSLDVRIWQALIAGAFVAGGWLFTHHQSQLEARRLRAEKLRDYHKALYAEIGSTLEALLDRDQADVHVAALLDRMRADETYIPFIPREKHDHVYDQLVGGIDVLPRQTIDAVVAYYSLIKTLAMFAEDLRGERFQRLSQDRRMIMYEDYVAMRVQAFNYGMHALALIRAFSEGGREAAERLNNQDADRSGPSQGSV